MATHQLGPEVPRPFSVISEFNSKQVNIPQIPESELYSFGPQYEAKMFELVHRYLELGTDDKLCYVGQDKGSLAPLLQDKFCLLEPVTTVNPGHIHYQESSSNNKRVPIKISHVGAEEYFRDEVRKGPQFDKILIKDSVQYFTHPKETYTNVMRSIRNMGRLLIIHRPAPMNTLPLSKDARGRMAIADEYYMQIIHDLQALYYDVQWEIECLPVVLPKVKWYAMLKERFPPQLELISNSEVNASIRELSEGILKYEGDMVEFQDRLLFISASHSVYTDYPSIQRFGASAVKPFPGMEDLRYQMELTSDLKKIMKAKTLESNQTTKAKRSDIGL